MLKVTRQNLDAAAKIRLLPELSSWNDADQALKNLRQYFPDNTNRVHVLIKASAIDKLYSTRAANIFWVADAIVAVMKENDFLLPVDGLIDIVEAISSKKRNAHLKATHCLSFASKYCHFFIDDSTFPLYDSFALAAVRNLLGRMSGRLTSGDNDNHEYRDFYERLSKLKVRDGLEDVSVREMDRFLWLWGQWILQKKREEKVVNEDVYAIFTSTQQTVQKLLEDLQPLQLV